MRRAAFLFLAVVLLGLLPQTAQAGTRGAFVVDCGWSHSREVDPIVAPGVEPSSHLHDFFGNRTVDANSTYESMLMGTTTCRDWDDTAGYWSPTGYLAGVQLSPVRQRIYYFGKADGSVQTIPPGLKMVAGTSAATSAAGNPNVSWNCGGSTPSSSHPYDCTPYAGGNATVDGVTGYVDFPQCWDGVNLDAADHSSHMAYEGARGCPADHPVMLPRLRLRVHYGIWDPCAGLTPCGPADPDTNLRFSLSSGAYYSLHADFWNTWKQPALNALVASCLNAHVACGEPVARTPDAPAVTARPGDRVVHLTWSPPGGSGVTGANVYRSTVSGAETLLATTSSGSSYDDTAVTNGATYFYTIAAVNGYGDGRRSAEVSASPHPPNVPDAPLLDATGGNASVHLSWTAPADGGSSIAGYTIYRATASGQEAALATTGTVTSYDDAGVANGTTYFYRVSAKNGIGEGALSNEASASPRAVTVPAAPTLTASRATSGLGVKLRWTVPADGGSAISGYRVYRGRSAGSEVFIAALGNVTAYKDTSTRSGTTYFYRVTALNGAGEGPSSNEALARAS